MSQPKHPALPALVALAAALLGATALGCASPALETPPGEAQRMTVNAYGVQVYQCQAAGPDKSPSWVFVAPEAELFDQSGRHIGHHGAGPEWQHLDGSGFKGTVRSRVPAPRTDAIPWLLLTAHPRETAGAFARVSSVQRVNTVGGQPPAFGCSAETVSRRVSMPYSADYVLLERVSGAHPVAGAAAIDTSTASR